MLVYITLFELMTVLIWTVLLYKKYSMEGGIGKVCVLLLLSCLALILGGQLASLYNTGHYTAVLTLSNIGSYEDVGGKVLLTSSLIILSSLVLTVLAAIFSRKGLIRSLKIPEMRPLDYRNAADGAIGKKIRDFFNLSEDRRFFLSYDNMTTANMWTVPNILTMTRILMIPVFVTLF